MDLLYQIDERRRYLQIKIYARGVRVVVSGYLSNLDIGANLHEFSDKAYVGKIYSAAFLDVIKIHSEARIGCAYQAKKTGDCGSGSFVNADILREVENLPR